MRIDALPAEDEQLVMTPTSRWKRLEKGIKQEKRGRRELKEALPRRSTLPTFPVGG